MRIEIRGNSFELLPEKAVFWCEKETLLIGDLHIGKIAHFRKEGIAVPQKASAVNFEKLDKLVKVTGAGRIIFLGDLFHSEYNSEWEEFKIWRAKHHYIDMLIVIGNHDVLPQSLFLEANISVFPLDYEEGDFVFTHHPKVEPDPDKFVFAGHVHPVFTAYGKGRQSLRLPCFVIDPHQAILPSFGVFTGGFQMQQVKGRKIFLASEMSVHAVC